MTDRNRFLRASLLVALIGAALLLLGCAQAEEPPTPEPATPEPTSTPAATARPTNTPRPSPTPSPTATPIPPKIEAEYQIIGPDGVLLIDAVTAPEDGWLVAYPDRQLELTAADALTFAPVPAGDSTGVELTLPENWDERTIQLALHGGRTDDDTFEPAMDDLLLLQQLEIDTPLTVPALQVSDQPVGDDGVLRIDRVFMPRPGWIAIFPEGNTDPAAGQLLGYAPLPAGETLDLPLAIRWREAPASLTAVLLADSGEEKVFEPAADTPVAVNGEEIVAPFEVTYPPDLVILDQPVVAGELVAQRVVSEGAGWLVVYEDEDGDGQPGFIIGFSPIENGLNTSVRVPVDPTAVSDQLLATLHDDTGDAGVFDFPGADPPRRYNDLAFYARVQTNEGSVLQTADQPAGADEIHIVLAVSPFDFWIIIHADEDGQPGEEVLGQLWLAAGFHQDVRVPLDAQPAGELVHAMLYTDNGSGQTFDRNQIDFPIQVRGRVVTIPISLFNE